MMIFSLNLLDNNKYLRKKALKKILTKLNRDYKHFVILYFLLLEISISL